MNPLIIVAFIAAIALGSGAIVGPRKAYASTYDHLFRRYANNPRLAKAVALVESSLDPSAIGDDGRAFGLMQIWYPTAQGHGYDGGPYGLLNPDTNIYYATRELNYLVSAYGFEKGIMGYNIGETRLRKGGSNQEYLNRVLKFYGEVVVS